MMKMRKETNPVVPEDLYLSIILNLKQFEEQKQFLKIGISLNTLAKKLKTNTSYLSKVINTNKNKNFANYLNDLRIDYAVLQLAEDKKLCTYKIASIAAEMGYKNEQTFSLAFKRKIGTTVSAYIKAIDSKESDYQNTG